MSGYSYPLDYVLSEGETFIDLTLNGSTFAWLYTRVPVDFISPIDCMETLEELYLPITEGYTQKTSKLRASSISANDWKILEEKSMEITGNQSDSDNSLLRAKWVPSHC